MGDREVASEVQLNLPQNGVPRFPDRLLCDKRRAMGPCAWAGSLYLLRDYPRWDRGAHLLSTDVTPAGAPDAAGRGGRMDTANLFWLLSALCLVLFLAFEPYLGFAVFGSDTGEYYRLTSILVTTGHLPIGGGYTGWGSAYPDFPGVYLLAAATSGAVGLIPIDALVGTIPALAVLSFLPLFLLFRRLFSNDSIAILGAAFATVMSPRLFSIAHPAPLALGDFFVVAALWMFVEGRRDARWYLPLVITSAALIVTHHLSSYFLLLSMLGSLLILELWHPGLWSKRFPLRELVFAAVFGFGLVAYWVYYAVAFRVVILEVGFPSIPVNALGPALILAVAAAVLLSAFLIRWRRRRPVPAGRVWVRQPTDRRLVLNMGVIFALVILGASVLILIPLPTTGQKATVMGVVFFLPLFITVLFASGTRHYLTLQRLGLFTVAWLLAVGISIIIAGASASPALPPDRSLEYLIIPVGLLIALGAARLVARWGDVSGRKALLAGSLGIVALLAANAAIAYPPPNAFAGFQEGLTYGDAGIWSWVGVGLPPSATVATDHRLSSMIFGVDGNPTTYQSTPALFIGTNRSAAFAELNGSAAPAEIRPVNAVAVDATIRYSGVALDPARQAVPMSSQAQAWLLEPPFIAVYENGPEAVYWVDHAAIS